MRIPKPTIVRSLAVCLAVGAIFATTGCAAPQPSELQYLKTLEDSHELDAKAVTACTQGYTPTPRPLAAKNSTLRAVRKLMAGTAELSRDTILSGNRQGYAGICILSTTDYGRPVTVAEYHLTPPIGGVGGGDGGGILEW